MIGRRHVDQTLCQRCPNVSGDDLFPEQLLVPRSQLHHVQRNSKQRHDGECRQRRSPGEPAVHGRRSDPRTGLFLGRRKAGSFGFPCDVFCGTGHEEMSGTLLVS